MSNGDVIIAANTGLFHQDKSTLWRQKTRQFYHKSVQSMVVQRDQVFAACGRSDIRQVVIFAQRNNNDWSARKHIDLLFEPCVWVTLSASCDVIKACSSLENVIACFHEPRQGRTWDFIRLACVGPHELTDRLARTFICDSDAYGNILVADENNHRLQVMTDCGQFSEFTVLDLNPIATYTRSAVYHNGDLYVVVGSNVLCKYSEADVTF